jgi:hypothetical protein
LTGKIKYKIEKVGEFKKLAERAYQKKMVEWIEKKYLDTREESNLTFSQLVKWFIELPVVRQNKTIKDIERACRDLRCSARCWLRTSNPPWWKSISIGAYRNQLGMGIPDPPPTSTGPLPC